MKAEYINPFLEAAVKVFDTMVGCQLTRQAPYLKTEMQPSYDISGIIGLAGKAKGTVVVTLDESVAIGVTEAMLMERPTEINSDVTDAIGELANMIAGSAKTKLAELEMSVSLPNVITGKGHCIEFPSDAPPICIPFTCDWGSIAVEVGLVESPVYKPELAEAAAT